MFVFLHELYRVSEPNLQVIYLEDPVKSLKSCKFRFTGFNKIVTGYSYNSTLWKFDVSRATLICFGCHWFESTGVKGIFSFSVWFISFLWPSLKRYILFGIFTRELQLATSRPLYMLNNAKRPNLTGYPFTYTL